MPVLITSKFDDDSIKNERASMETAFSIISLWESFRRSRAANSVVSEWSDLAEIRTRPRFYACPRYVQV